MFINDSIYAGLFIEFWLFNFSFISKAFLILEAAFIPVGELKSQLILQFFVVRVTYSHDSFVLRCNF